MIWRKGQRFEFPRFGSPFLPKQWKTSGRQGSVGAHYYDGGKGHCSCLPNQSYEISVAVVAVARLDKGWDTRMPEVCLCACVDKRLHALNILYCLRNWFYKKLRGRSRIVIVVWCGSQIVAPVYGNNDVYKQPIETWDPALFYGPSCALLVCHKTIETMPKV